MASTSSSLPGKASSVWIETAHAAGFTQLTDNIKVHAAIIGAGIVGLTTAMLLHERGVKVALIEAERIGQGVTGHTTAKLTSAHGLVYSSLIDHSGEEHARQYADGNQAAIEFVAAQVESHGIDCDFRRTSAYTYAETEKEVDAIEEEAKAALKLNLPASYVASLPVTFPFKGAVRFDNQAQFHPMKYLKGLLRVTADSGCLIFEKTRATQVEDGTPCRVTTEKGQIEAEHVIVATNFPIINTGYFFAKMEPIRSYVLCLKLKSGMPEGLFYCSSEPYHTVRPHFDKDGAPLFVLVGGEDHKTGKGGDTVERYRNVERFAREHFDIESIDYRWSTQDNDPVDNVPYVGRPSKDSKNVYIATGLKGWGMSGGTLAGMILADLVSGQENPWAPVFDPKRRIPFSAVDDLIALNAKVAKDLFGGHLSTIRVKALSEIGTGEADIAEVDDQKVAAFKDQDGTVNAVSPNCTHMGCVVSWNNGEQSWDCPCHGSRFAIDGRVLHSPAVSPLERKK